jgi:stage II sporulation protein AB (anti-sigma F factor)
MDEMEVVSAPGQGTRVKLVKYLGSFNGELERE